MIEHLIPTEPPRRELLGSYPLRVKFWLTSVCAHVLWTAVVIHIPLSTPASRRPVFEQFIRPMQSKVLIYRPKKEAQATPEKQVGKAPDPRGKIQAPRTAIATAPEAKSQKQIVWKPVNLPELKTDVPAPNVVARIETAIPPPPARAAPKQFTPPPPVKPDPKLPSAEVSASLAPAPAVAVATPLAAKGTLPPPPKIAPKQFVPPKPSERDPKLAVRTEVNVSLAQPSPVALAQDSPAIAPSNLPPPPKIAPKQFQTPQAVARVAKSTNTDITEALVQTSTVALAQTGPAPRAANLPPPPKTPPKQFQTPASPARSARPTANAEVSETLAAVNTQAVTPATPSITLSRLPAPPRDAAPAPENVRGNEKANVAIANVNPTPAAPIPTNPRSGQFSTAPVAGETSSGATAAGAVTVPNVTLREPAPPKPPPPAKSNTVIYTEKVRVSATATFTVPLRAANRSIPRALEARFAGRSVYTVVIPIENLPAYGGDWILWFAETAAQPGQTPSVRAPVPLRKVELQENNREAKDTRIQIAGKLAADGKLLEPKVLSPVSAEVQAMALEDLASWEWQAATRNGVAMSIDAVFEIPFRLGLRP